MKCWSGNNQTQKLDLNYIYQNQEKELKIYPMKILKIKKFLIIETRKFGMDFKRKG